jgi:Xaa-Pro aminopeptidase
VGGISAAEFSERRERLLDHLKAEGLVGWVLFDEKYIQYFTGFGFLATERPVAVASNTARELVAFVPEFEVERVRAETDFDNVESYPEYPGLEHPMKILARVLADHGVGAAIGADQDGYPGILGYEGPSLSEVTGARVAPLAPVIERLMRIKSAAELELIRESARWCGVAHGLLQEYSVPGATEAEASLRASHEATLQLYGKLGDEIGQQASSDGATAGYRGQIGRRSAWAHAVAHNIAFSEGDLLVTETSAPIWGYNAELERAMVVGAASDAAKRLFEYTVGAQDAAFVALRPGVTCADVDNAVLRYFEQHGLLQGWRQHVGHAIGLRNHESPFLDVGDQTVIRPGMVFTIEPGVYDEGVGGCRHSDTVAVTEDGIEILTDYPRDLESLTIAA